MNPRDIPGPGASGETSRQARVGPSKDERVAHLVALLSGVVVLVGGLVLEVGADADEVLVGGQALPLLCPFRALTLRDCPGCGMTRSVVAFLHLDWSRSISCHPAGFLLALVALAQIPYRGALLMAREPPRWLAPIGHGALILVGVIAAGRWLAG